MGATGGVVGATTGGGVGSKTGGIVPTTGGSVVTASVTAGVGLEVSISMAGKDIEMDSASASRTTVGTNVTAVDSTGAMVGTTSMTGPSPSSPVKSIEPDRSTMEMQDDMLPSEITGNCSRLLLPSPNFRGCRSSTTPPAGALLWTSVFRRRFGWEGTTDDDVDDADDARRTMAAGMESFIILCSGWQIIIMIESIYYCVVCVDPNKEQGGGRVFVWMKLGSPTTTTTTWILCGAGPVCFFWAAFSPYFSTKKCE